MSWYYSYSIGVLSSNDGKIHQLGPYDNDGKLLDVACNSKSFEPEELHDGFIKVDKTIIDDDLFEKYGDCLDLISYCPLSDLPRGDYLKSGYYLIEDVKLFTDKKAGCWDDIFCDHLNCEDYLNKMENELKFGIPKPRYDCEGNEIEYHPCSDYMKFAYIDYSCAEYFADQLRLAASWFSDYRVEKKYGKDSKFVVILVQG